MLFLIFHLGEEPYAIPAKDIVEVVHAIPLRALPMAHPAIAGVFNFRGQAVPVVDLCQLVLGRPAQKRLSTRLIVARFTDSAGGVISLGLLAERVEEVRKLSEEDFKSSGIASESAPYLGRVSMVEKQVIQRFHFDRILPPEVARALSAEGEATLKT